jgi:signal transduction histidine kinase
MIAVTGPSKSAIASFRTKLWVAMMLVIFALTALGLYLAQRNVATTAERDLQRNFQTELSSLHKLEELRDATLAERCLALASKPRIHAALEDNALDLLYPSAKDELRDLMEGEEPPSEQAASALHARFYRFLDDAGAVLPSLNSKDIGVLSKKAEAQLSLPKLPEKQQIGYLSHADGVTERVDEVIAFPIFSTETGELISALVVGFKPLELAPKGPTSGMKSGIWVNGRVHLASVSQSEQAALGDEIARAITKSDSAQSNLNVRVNGAPHLLFYKQFNPGSLFPPAYEICVYPLASSMAQLHRLRWQIGGAGVLLLFGGFVASHFVALRFSKPVEQLALDSEQNRAQRALAEAALISTSEKLKRSTRYSADASHQLKSPVTLLRAGIEGLLAREDFGPEVYEELSALLHQTRRLTGVIDDLLLLSRMDAGHLEIRAEPVNLSQLINEWLEDIGALPDSFDVTIEKNFPAELYVAGEKRYTSLIVQNLVENARKYNRPGGRIRVAAEKNGRRVFLAVGNTGCVIPPDAQQHIFERFHRGSSRSKISGHGLGLNLARNLTRLHGGEIRLLRSENDWTEFEVCFDIAAPPNTAAGNT